MCQYCEDLNNNGELETWTDPEFEFTRAYLDCSSDGTWWLTTASYGTTAVTICVRNCPWCGRELE